MTTIDTGTEDLLARKENGVGYLVMNRPEARNAMSQEMNKAMQDTIAAFELDNEVRCIVLTGLDAGFLSGPKRETERRTTDPEPFDFTDTRTIVLCVTSLLLLH